MKERREEKKEKGKGEKKGGEERRSDQQHFLKFPTKRRSNSSEQEAKFIYATRASRRHQDSEFSSNSKR